MSADGAAEAPETPAEPEVKDVGVDVEIPADPPKDPDPKPSRGERRAARGAAYDQEARAARDAARAADERAQKLEVELAELRGRVTAGESGRPDPHQRALDAIATQMENVVVRMGQGDESARAEWHTLRREESKLIAKQEAETAGKGVEERVTKSIPRPLDPRQSALMAEFPDLSDPSFKSIAEGHVSRLIRTQNRDMDNPNIRFATLREGAALAARDLGIGGNERKEPTQRDRERVSGTGSGDSGAGGGKTTVHLTDGQKKMAEQLFRNLDPAQAHVKWWKEVGQKIADKK